MKEIFLTLIVFISVLTVFLIYNQTLIDLSRKNYFKIIKLNSDPLIFTTNSQLSSSSSIISTIQVINKTEEKIEPSPVKYALLSSNIDDTNNLFYIFYLPFTAQAWRTVGYEPVVLLVTSQKNNLTRYALKTIEYLNLLNVKLVYIDCDPDYQVITSMVGRLFVGVLDEEIVKEQDFVITSDADLIPLQKSYYEANINNTEIKVWNAFCCGNFDFKGKSIAMYPIGHIGMRKYQWKEMMQLNDSTKLTTKSVIEVIKRFFDDSVVKKNSDIGRGDATWYLDQTIVGVSINNYVNEQKKAPIYLRGYTGMRLDRADYDTLSKVKSNFDSHTDFHAFHNNFRDQWLTYEEIMKRIFSQNYTDLISQYFKEFTSIN